MPLIYGGDRKGHPRRRLLYTTKKDARNGLQHGSFVLEVYVRPPSGAKDYLCDFELVLTSPVEEATMTFSQTDLNFFFNAFGQAQSSITSELRTRLFRCASQERRLSRLVAKVNTLANNKRGSTSQTKR